jgi:hypothetical protein
MEGSPARRHLVAVLVLAGCGRTALDNTPPTTADAATGTDGLVWDTGGFADTRASANNSGDTGSAGQCGSQVTFQIVATPTESFCAYGCDNLWTIAFASGLTRLTASDVAESTCLATCDQCDARPVCPPCAGFLPFPATGFNYSWDGSYFATGGTCGTLPCRGSHLCASPGHYTGEFCAMRGSASVSSYSYGCTPTQDTACRTVEFDLPSTTTIAVDLGP